VKKQVDENISTGDFQVELFIRETELEEDQEEAQKMAFPLPEINEALLEIEEDKIEEDKDIVRSPMNTVTDGIILGVIPKQNQIDDIIREAEQSKYFTEIDIISVTDEFEQGMQNMLQPYEIDLLKEKEGISFKHHQVPMTDFGADITTQSVLATVYKIRQIVEDGGFVYIHCKAGRARSAMIVATYLAIFDDEIKNQPDSLKLAVKKLVRARPQVDLHDDRVNDWSKLMEQSDVKKLQKAQDTINLHHAIENRLQSENKTNLSINDYIEKFNIYSKDNNWDHLAWVKPTVKKTFIRSLKQIITKETKPWHFNKGNSPLSTYEFKNELINNTNFKQLKIEIMQSQNPLKSVNKKYLKELNKKIYESTDDSWYTEFKEKKGPLWKLYINSKITDNLRKTINSFIRDIEFYKQEQIHAKIKARQAEAHALAERKSKEKKLTSMIHSVNPKTTETKIFSAFAKHNLKHATSFASDAAPHVKKKKMSVKHDHDLAFINESDMVSLGSIYVKLILDAAKISGETLDKIQFNFCINELPSDKETIQKAIEMYVNYRSDHQVDDGVSQEDLHKLHSIIFPFTLKLPVSGTNLPRYDEVLLLRGKSFCNAAEKIIDYSELTDANLKNATKIKISKLFDSFHQNMPRTLIKSEQQAYYDAYIQSLKELLINTFSNSEKEITKYLKNAETICNMKDKQVQVTLSGNLEFHHHSLSPRGELSLQIEEPLTTFKYLTPEQQQAWISAIKASESDDKISVPTWFSEMPAFEKKIWKERLNVDDQGHANMNAHMVPVAKKQGVPGLRNLALSTFATIKYNELLPTQIFVTEKSVRSSSLVVQKKEGASQLNKDEQSHTKMNIDQIAHIYKEEGIEKRFMGLWHVDKNRPKHLLCQTLLRKFGGGDNDVIRHKDKALKESQSSYFLTHHGSNHCIGAENVLLHGIMHSLGTNTQTLNHVVEPVADFITIAVIPNLNKAMPGRIIDDQIKPLYVLAEQGKLKLSDINKAFETGYLKDYKQGKSSFGPKGQEKNAEVAKQHVEQLNTLKRVLLALSMYKQTNDKPDSYKKPYQLHMAALEEIIYQETGNQVQSSCKSGKDREGMEKTYRNAMYKFFDDYGYFPPAKVTNDDQDLNLDRQNFIKIFIELFKSNHQARLAELNAEGCQGLKALKNIIPQDILTELKRMYGEGLLDTHRENASLNVLGVSDVVKDNLTYKHAKAIYSDITNNNSKDTSKKPLHDAT
jgi:protein-tyrosine phosphatase